MIKRIFGIILLLVGVSGVVLAVVGAIVLPRVVGDLADSAVTTLQQTGEGLDAVQESMLLARTTVGDLTATLDTVEENVDLIGRSLNESGPLLDQVVTVTSDELPGSIESLQAAIPDLAQAAAAVDDTLRLLNAFRIDEELLGIPLRYDLGIDYAPERPFDETVIALGSSLDGLPGQLRSLRIYVNVSRNNLEAISQGLFDIADDLGTVNGRLVETEPLLDEYVRIVIDISDQTRILRQQIEQQSARAQTILRVAMIWLAFSQLTPLVLGWELVRGNR